MPAKIRTGPAAKSHHPEPKRTQSPDSTTVEESAFPGSTLCSNGPHIGVNAPFVPLAWLRPVSRWVE